MEDTHYQLFGSQYSQDIDVVFFVEKIPETTAECAALSRLLCSTFPKNKPDKRVVNGNLAVCENGQLTAVFKGTTDELNNALFYTYSLHEQQFENKICLLLERDIDLKFLRATRTILSYFTRTAYRKQIKAALQGDIDRKFQVLNECDWGELFEKDASNVDMFKSIAFQLGQSLALAQGVELYTKSAIAGHFPHLSPFLDRITPSDFTDLHTIFALFRTELDNRRKTMRIKVEYRYRERK